MNILITGATGFIGRYLVEELSKKGQGNIFCLVRNPHKAKLLEPFGVKLIYADITQKASLSKFRNYKFKYLYHLAACVENKNPELLYKVNILGSQNICELALSLGVERFIYTSSVAVVSGNSQVPLTESLPFKATNAYGQSKIEAEKIVLKYREAGLKTIIVRPPMVYGEAEPHLMPFLFFLTKYRLFPLLNRGQSKLHLGYLGNIVEAMIFLADKDQALEGSFFLGDDEVLTVGDLFDTIAETLGVKPPLNIPAWLKPLLLNLPFLGRKINFFSKDRVYSLERLRSLGFKAPFRARESLKRCAQSFLPR